LEKLKIYIDDRGGEHAGMPSFSVMPEWFYRASMHFSLGGMLFPGFPLKTCGNDRGGEHAGMPSFFVMPECLPFPLPLVE